MIVQTAFRLPARSLLALAAAAAALALGGACNTRPIAKPGEAPAQVTPDTFNQALNNKADILFMIDNSNSMAPKQCSLRQYFPNFIQPLKDLATKPDLHLGIVTSDMGAGQFSVPTCETQGGDQGILQNTEAAPPVECPEVKCGNGAGQGRLNNAADRFLTYSPSSSGGAAVNFTGDIADAFACYAALGTGGCGFEHQLASVRAALAGCESDSGCSQHQNENFFRKDAYLAVILLTDEDDCSAPSTSTLFDPSQTSVSTQLGPLSSYRCFEFGNLCGGASPNRNQGERQDCAPGNPDPSPAHELIPTQDIAEFLKALKPQDPRMVYVSVIAGPPAPVSVGVDGTGNPKLQPSCSGGIGTADPATRLSQFVTYFDPDRASFISICQSDLKQAMEKIAQELAQILGRQCLGAPLKNKTPGAALTPDCVVQDRTTVNAVAGDYQYATVPACGSPVCDPATVPGGDCKCAMHDGASPQSPCWYVWPDPGACPVVDPDTSVSQATSVGSGYQILVDRGTNASCVAQAPPVGTYAIIQCSSCIANPSANSYDCSAGCAEKWPNCCPADGSTPAPGCFGG
jgi:hypothetical protein